MTRKMKAILVLFFAAEIVNSAKVGVLKGRIADLETQRDIYASRAQNWLDRAVEDEEVIDSLQIRLDETADRKIELTEAGTFFCTAYCTEQYEHICGEGHGITASGQPIQAGVTVAADTSIFPYGTVLYIENVGIQRFQKFKMRLQGKAKNLDLFRMRKKFRVQVERNFPTLSHERFSIVEPVVQFEKLLGNIIVFINGVAGGFLCLLHRYFVRLDFLRLRHIILDFLKNFSLFFGLGLAEIFEKIIGNVQFLAEEPITETGRQFIRNVNAVGIVFCTAD